MRITETGVYNLDGTRAMPIPFYVWSWFRWKPICAKHRLIFRNDERYAHHWTPLCDDVAGSEYPASDYKRHLKGYRKG